MARYFTSDWHLCSNNIIKYAHRPFVDALDALTLLVKNTNKTCSKTDVLFHVGDFILTSKDSHGSEDDLPLKTYPVDYILNNINARMVLLAGNHDDGHGIEADMKSMVVDLNQNYHNVYVNHFPSSCHEYKGPRRIHKGMPFIALCGHVHDKWLLKYDHENNVLNINVGVDVWDYKPVRDSQITELLDFVLKFDIFDRTWAWKRNDLNMYIEAWKHQLELGRTARKNERYAKKGLTKEECERRRIEAMKAKGLI